MIVSGRLGHHSVPELCMCIDGLSRPDCRSSVIVSSVVFAYCVEQTVWFSLCV